MLTSETRMTAVDKDTELGKGVLEQWDLENAGGSSFLRPLHLSQAVQGRTRGTVEGSEKVQCQDWEPVNSAKKRSPERPEEIKRLRGVLRSQ